LINAGAKKISLMGTNEPGSIYILGLSEQALKGAGVTPTTWVKADPQADPTFAASAALAMANGVDGIVLSSSQLLMPKEVTALRQAGYKGLISSLSAIFAEKTREALGDQANGILVSGLLAFQSDTANPEVARYLAEMQKYAPSTDTNENSMVTWAAIQLFATVMKSADGYNSEDVLSAFNNVSSPVEIGVIGPFQVKGAKEYLPDFSRIFNPTVSNGKIVDGELVSDGQGFVNPFEPINAAGN
jgi:ABC-type branched-subunit amino acid transport system substrate-binding protein